MQPSVRRAGVSHTAVAAEDARRTSDVAMLRMHDVGDGMRRVMRGVGDGTCDWGLCTTHVPPPMHHPRSTHTWVTACAE